MARDIPSSTVDAPREDGDDTPDDRGNSAADDADDGRSAVATLRIRLRTAITIPVTDCLLMLLVTSTLVAMLTRAVQTYTTSFVFADGASATGANVVFVVLLLRSGVASLSAGNLADRFDHCRLGIAIAVITAALLGVTRLLPDNLSYAAVLG